MYAFKGDHRWDEESPRVAWGKAALTFTGPSAFYIVRARVHTFLRASPDTIHSNLANSNHITRNNRMEIFSPGHGNFHFQSKKKVFGSIFLSLSLGYKDGKRVYIYIYITRMRNSLELHETFRRSYVRNILSSLEIFLFLRNLWNARRKRYTKISNFSACRQAGQAERRDLVVKLHAANNV